MLFNLKNSGVIKKLAEIGYLGNIEKIFIELLYDLTPDLSDWAIIIICLVFQCQRQGKTYLELEPFPENYLKILKTAGFTLPEKNTWQQYLCVPVFGACTTNSPLVLSAGRVYFRRFWDYEQKVADMFKLRAHSNISIADIQSVNYLLDQCFPQTTEINWQRFAAFLALKQYFAVISGGPGTGKTTILANILGLLLMLNKSLKIAIAAPTGKAAGRINESLQKALEKAPFNAEIKLTLSQLKAVTIHRLLKLKPQTGRFFFNSKHQLPYDVLIIDEASMLDIELMYRVAQALTPQTRLLLFGDRFQLAAVETGSFFSELCNLNPQNQYSSALIKEYQTLQNADLTKDAILEINNQATALADSIVTLQKSWRFAADSGIGVLADQLIKKQQLNMEMSDFAKKYADLTWYPITTQFSLANIHSELETGFKALFNAESPEQALSALAEYRVLCALKEGPLGVAAINNYIIKKVLKQNKIAGIFKGLPLMITKNDYRLKLFNGETGVVFPDHAGNLKAWFSTDSGIRQFNPAVLPPYEYAYAITIHKSQGSEFNRVLMVLPATELAIVTQELIYTGLTRARKSVGLAARQEVINAGLKRRAKILTGLFSGI